jgi:hypothetical protein
MFDLVHNLPVHAVTNLTLGTIFADLFFQGEMIQQHLLDHRRFALCLEILVRAHGHFYCAMKALQKSCFVLHVLHLPA